MMRRPVAVLATVGALWLLIACLDVSSPVSGILAITPVLLPTLPVVPKPISATKDTDFSFTFDPGVTDTLSTALVSPAMNVTVHGTADTTIQSYVVSYQIIRTPVSKDGKPTVVIYDRSGNDSTV